MAEVCIQCKQPFDAELPVVAIMASADAEKLNPQSVIKIDGSGVWAALPICVPCHKNPKIKAHFFYRNQWRQGLSNAGASDLG